MQLLSSRTLRYLSILLFLTFYGTCVRAQINVVGRVIDSLTNEPVAFATVYLDGTSTGDLTGDDGGFRIAKARLPAVLVVSHLSYETSRIALNSVSDSLRIYVNPVRNELTSIELRDENGYAKNKREFKLQLLGNDDWATQSSIGNDEVVVFDRDYAEREVEVFSADMKRALLARNRPSARWNTDSSRYYWDYPVNLKASTRGPLEIRLPHLGYTVRADYESFVIEYETGRTTHLGTYFFQPAERVSKKQVKNRRRAYFGSAMHFARALVADSLRQNGFQVFEVTDDEHGGETVREYDIRQHLHAAEVGHNLTKLEGRRFAILYNADKRGEPARPEKWGKIPAIQSRLVVDANSCRIYPGGVFGDTYLVFSGDMGRRAMAWGLPNDFLLE